MLAQLGHGLGAVAPMGVHEHDGLVLGQAVDVRLQRVQGDVAGLGDGAGLELVGGPDVHEQAVFLVDQADGFGQGDAPRRAASGQAGPQQQAPGSQGDEQDPDVVLAE